MELCEDIIECDIQTLEPIRLEVVSTENMSKLWKEYVDRHHMLKAKAAIGSQLRYIIKSGDRDVGCLQFSASALALSERDKWIGWSKEDREKRLHLVINNSRFLVLPDKKSEFTSAEDELQFRQKNIEECTRVYRELLPVMLARLSKIEDPRQQIKVKHKTTVLMIYGMLTFVLNLASSRNVNEKMTMPIFYENLQKS